MSISRRLMTPPSRIGRYRTKCESADAPPPPKTGEEYSTERPMSDDDIDVLKPETILKPKIEQPRLYKVVLLNDDYTPREFVVQVLKAVFRTTEDQAYRIMMTAHQRGVCVVATFTRDVAESKAKEATDMGRQKGYPLEFSTEPEE